MFLKYILIGSTRMLLKICCFYVLLHLKEEKTFQFMAFGNFIMASCTSYMVGAKMCIIFYSVCLKVHWATLIAYNNLSTQ